MAENEKKLLEDLAALPKPIREDFTKQIIGAATAVRVMAAEAQQGKDTAPEKSG